MIEYIGGIVGGMKHKPLIVNGAKDHMHILLGLKPASSISSWGVLEFRGMADKRTSDLFRQLTDPPVGGLNQLNYLGGMRDLTN